MRHIHPFPARMAPEIALDHMKHLQPKSVVLDPMSGSGLVISQASRLGHTSIGCDIDPLARLVSKVSSTKVDCAELIKTTEKLIDLCNKDTRSISDLSWVDQETEDFVKYWFDKKQIIQLSTISYYLIESPCTRKKNIIEAIKIAISRLIITKEPKASLARDTAHSRPHKTIDKSDFDILNELSRSVNYVIKTLDTSSIIKNSKVLKYDARNLKGLQNTCIDIIITSPPYLNAIDYMRGHKFSLVWFGYQISELRNIRAESIGSEKIAKTFDQNQFNELSQKINLGGLGGKYDKIIFRYYIDLYAQLKESYRVLKNGGTAVYVIGNSNLQGIHVKNNEILMYCANNSGFKVLKEVVRDIPDNRRYLPVKMNKNNPLSKRMRTEHIIKLLK